MHTLIFRALFLSLLLIFPLSAEDIGGVTLEKQLMRSGNTLLLQGAGMRQKFFLDLYVAGLYTATPNHNAQKIIDADAPMALTLHIVSKLITSEKMQEATHEGFEKSTHGNRAPLNDAIQTFIAVFDEPIVKGDLFELFYTPSKGVSIYKNGKYKQTIKGLAFKKALFGIWLGKESAQESLKKELVGE
ncbi:MAG: chalcone isomerase family protein [Campylobacterales bacterium]|nr:chalcone isomerase family protein [Campylobacterales bacterium]